MALDQKFFKKSTTAATGTADQVQGLISHLDANDVDSYDGDGSIWYDIASYNVNVPLADKASNLVLNLDGGTYTSGAWEDQSDNTNNASLNGNTTYNSDTKGYFTLDGAGDYLQISDHSSLNLAGSGATYEMWFRQPTLAASEHLFGRYETGNFDFFISTGSSGAISLHFYNGSSSIGNIDSGGSKYTANTWHHLAVTLSSGSSGGTIKLYIDGNLHGSTTLSGNRVADPTADLYLGILGSGFTTQYEFTGDIGTTRIYNVALTASEVAQNFRAGNNLSYSSIITSKHEATQSSLVTVPPTQGTLYTSNLGFHLDANGHSGTYWTDSANNINGTINGATYVNDNNSDYFTFDGSNDTVTFPASDTSPINFSSETHAIEFWVNFNNLANDDVILGKFGGSNTTKSFQIQVSSTNKLTILERDGGSNNTFETTGTFSTGTWTHFIYARSASQVILYINGALDSTHSASNAINAGSTQDITIGNQAGASVYFDGKLAQLRIYSSTLNSSQVLTNYNATKNLYQGVTNLQLSLDANEYSGSGNWQDSANNNDGVINGATYTNDNNSDYFNFDGSNDYINVAGSDLNPANTRCIEFWFNTNSTAEQYVISNNNGSGAYGYHMGVTSGKLFMWIYSEEQAHYHVNTSTGSSNTAAITTGEWNHAVYTMGPNASDNKIYLNGNLAYTESSMGGGTYPSSAAYDGINIGKYTSSGWFNGKLAQVRAYKGTMTAAQVKTNYDATKALYQNPTALIDYRPDQYSGSGTSITNLGSLSNDAVLTGGIESTYDKELGDFFTIDGGSNTGDGIETTSNVTGVNLNTDGFSWEIWVNITSDSYSYITSFNYSSTYYNFSYRSDSNKVMFFNLGTALTTPALDLNRWYHIVGTANSAGTKLYTDGVLSASNTTAAPNHNLDSKIYFGTYWGHNSAQHIHTGPIGDGRFYKGVLTAEQVAQNYLATKNKYTNGNNATITGASWNTNSSPAYNYFTFDGSNDKMEIAHSSDVQIDGPYTWMFWFRPHNTNSGKYLMSKIQNSPYGQNILLQSSNVIRFTGYSSGGNGSRHETATSAFTDNAWQHLAITIEGNSSGDDIDFFINGSQVGHSTGTYSSATLTQDQASDTSNANLFLGAYQFGSSPNHFFDGDIGYYKCFKKQLSSAEILTEYNATKGTYGL